MIIELPELKLSEADIKFLKTANAIDAVRNMKQQSFNVFQTKRRWSEVVDLFHTCGCPACAGRRLRELHARQAAMRRVVVIIAAVGAMFLTVYRFW